MEPPQVQYRLSSVKNKSFYTEKRSAAYTTTNKSKSRQAKNPAPQKKVQKFFPKPQPKLIESKKYSNYDEKAYHTPNSKGVALKNERGSFPHYQYCPQYFLAAPMVYPELIVPVYGYPICYMKNTYIEPKPYVTSSPQDLGYSGCLTVASEDDLNKSIGDECGFKVVCNGNVILKDGYIEVKNDTKGQQSFISLSEHEEHLLSFTESEPKREAIPLPSFLALQTLQNQGTNALSDL